ncbi:MAG: SAM-dependent chlorinase/fluorinase [Actinobacteria bacterium]|nr:SAM-dependent chlorinase/fluorinase [Actinomycetota bacterium]
MAEGLPITFLSDYGDEDEFAGVCRAVIGQIAPDAPLVDLTHGIGRQGIRQGALALANALPFCPPGIHLAVVDPGVGTPRRPVAVTAVEEGRFLVGPDNGLLWPAIERFGGAARAIDLSSSPFRLEPVSSTFHGRDLFAPVAAHLALGATLDEAGEKFDPSELAPLELPTPQVEPGRIVAHALVADRFGNVALDLDAEGAEAGSLVPGGVVEVRGPDGRFEARWVGTFQETGRGELLLCRDSSGRMALAANGGSAEGLLDLSPDDEVELRPL